MQRDLNQLHSKFDINISGTLKIEDHKSHLKLTVYLYTNTYIQGVSS